MFDYIVFNTGSIEDGDMYFTPDVTYAKVADIGYKSILDTLYFFAVYRITYSDDSPEDYRLYGSTGDKGIITSAKYVSDMPQIIFNGDDDFVGSLDFYGTFATETEAKEAMNNSYPEAGCRDESATNYDATATLDDGTCIYGDNYTPYIIGGVALAAVYFIM